MLIRTSSVENFSYAIVSYTWPYNVMIIATGEAIKRGLGVKLSNTEALAIFPHSNVSQNVLSPGNRNFDANNFR